MLLKDFIRLTFSALIAHKLRSFLTMLGIAVGIAAVILLVAIVAAIALTLRRRKDTKYQNPAKQVEVKRQHRIRIVSMPAETNKDGPNS